jgi:hypothetical protein
MISSPVGSAHRNASLAARNSLPKQAAPCHLVWQERKLPKPIWPLSFAFSLANPTGATIGRKTSIWLLSSASGGDNRDGGLTGNESAKRWHHEFTGSFTGTRSPTLPFSAGRAAP